MIEYLIQLDKELLIFLNGLNTPILDKIMVLVSERFFWIPLYILLVGSIIYQFKKQSIFILLSIGLLIAATDRISSGLIKPKLQRLRPCHDTSINNQIRMIDGCGGRYGFVSSHAANSFAIALFLVMIAGNKYKWLWFLFPWALLVSYSRIYLGVHYPGDIIAGGLLGLLIASIFYKLYHLLNLKIFYKENSL